MEALEAIRPEEAGPETAEFGLSGRLAGRRVTAATATAGLGTGLPGIPSARAWPLRSAASAPPRTRSPRSVDGSRPAW